MFWQVAFASTLLFDGGQSLLILAARVKDTFRGRGVYGRFRRQLIQQFSDRKLHPHLHREVMTANALNSQDNGDRMSKSGFRKVFVRVSRKSELCRLMSMVSGRCTRSNESEKCDLMMMMMWGLMFSDVMWSESSSCFMDGGCQHQLRRSIRGVKTQHTHTHTHTHGERTPTHTHIFFFFFFFFWNQQAECKFTTPSTPPLPQWVTPIPPPSSTASGSTGNLLPEV